MIKKWSLALLVVCIFLPIFIYISGLYKDGKSENMEPTDNVYSKPTDNKCNNRIADINGKQFTTNQYLNPNPNRLYTVNEMKNLVLNLNKIDMGPKTLANNCLMINPLKKIHGKRNYPNGTKNTYTTFKPDYLSEDNTIAMDVCEDSSNISSLNSYAQKNVECFTPNSNAQLAMTTNDKAYLMVCSTLLVGLLFVASRKLTPSM